MGIIMIFVKLDRLDFFIKRLLVNIAFIHLHPQLLLVKGEIKTISALALQQPIIFSLHFRDGD